MLPLIRGLGAVMAWDKSGGRNGPAGSMVRGGPRGQAQLVRSSGWQWSDEAEAIFLDTLAASANVTLSADAAGFSTPTVYRLKARRPDFADKWRVALIVGFDRLEEELLRAAIDSIVAFDYDEKRPIARMTAVEAMNVLRAHRHEVRETGRGHPGARARVRRIEEVRESILTKIEAIERGMARAAAEHPGVADSTDL